MEREQIIKALECCYDNNLSCIDCPFNASDKYAECAGLTLSAIGLIKELTEENEKLTKRLEKEAKCQYDLAGQIVDLKAENKRLRELVTTKEIEKEIVRRETRADTVKKMQEKLYARRVRYGNITFKVVPIDEIDQIEKEMLEEK